MRRFIPRVPLFRTIAPRISAPLLPVSTRLTIRPPTGALTGATRTSTPRLFSHFPARLSNVQPSSSSSSSSSSSHELPPNASLSQRLRHLIKSYGWYALGMYIAISTLDLGVAFVGINMLGADQVSRLEAWVKQLVRGLLSGYFAKAAEPGREEMEPVENPAGGREGFMAMAVLAYTVHKLFLPVRVGLTAALTPRLVRWLRTRGWAGGEGTRRAAEEMRQRMRGGRKD